MNGFNCHCPSQFLIIFSSNSEINCEICTSPRIAPNSKKRNFKKLSKVFKLGQLSVLWMTTIWKIQVGGW